jgi:hypothetical protein
VTIRNLDTADPQLLVAKWRAAHERAERLEKELALARGHGQYFVRGYERAEAEWKSRANRAERIVEQIRAAFEEDYIDVPEHGWVLRPRGLRRIAEILERTK